MVMQLSLITLLVQDYDEAIAWYTGKLNFQLLEDNPLNADKRWVVIAAEQTSITKILLAKAATKYQRKQIGLQAGGRVFLFLNTADFWQDYNDLIEKKVEFVREPTAEIYGTVAVFKDLYGNLWDLIGPVK